MNRYIISGGKSINGSIKCQGSKNAVLPILTASILNQSKSKISNCPKLRDVDIMIKILKRLGCKVEVENDEITLDSSTFDHFEIDQSLMREMRSSIIFMGPMLAKANQVIISYPGGCDIGQRPIDMHISGLSKLGAKIEEERGFIRCTADRLQGADIYLDFPSVGATENIMCAAVLAKGDTYIRNAAREPEIIDLENFLVAMGAKVSGAGTNVIKIKGVSELHEVEYRAMPDRIVAGTYLAAAAITSGSILIDDIRYGHMESFLSKFREMGCKVVRKNGSIILEAPNKLKTITHIRTAPYPGFPTDMQQIFMSLLAVSSGTAMVVETIFENRFRQVNELMRMGAYIKVDGRVAVVNGVDRLYGTTVTASDLRGGASLIIAGLVAEGETIVEDEKHVERGYMNIEGDLTKIGAQITKESI